MAVDSLLALCGPTRPVLAVGAAGIVGMCKEHLGVALALKVPVFFVITKVSGIAGRTLNLCVFTVGHRRSTPLVLD